MQGKRSIERMCQLACVSRAGFYRSLQQRDPVEEDMAVRTTIQKIFAEHQRRYGYRRVSQELRRRGMLGNHKRVSRLMREDNLLAVQPQAFVITTDSDHDFEVYLNLASRMKLTGPQPAMGGRYHLHPAASRVDISGGDSGRIFAQGTRLGTGPNADRSAADSCAGEGYRGSPATARRGASFRSRRPVRIWRLCRPSAKARQDPEHEPAGEPV